MARRTFIKNATIVAKAPYPPVSAWEFRHITTEMVVRERLSASTVYFIVQRPLLWFDNIHSTQNPLRFDIVDGTGKCMHCLLDVYDVLRLADDDTVDIELGWHEESADASPPFRNVASIRVYRDGAFLAWWSPAKLLFEVSTRNLPLRAAGNLDGFTDYDVHYIGQAHDQKVWERLRKHSQLQDVLTEEDVRGSFHRRPALEVSLITLEIVGCAEEVIEMGEGVVVVSPHAPILHSLDCDPPGDEVAAFHMAWFAQGDPRVTNELEAMLIKMFQPKYNIKKYKNYPLIANGARSAGYTYVDVAVTDFPFRLRDANGGEPLQDAD